MSESQSFLSFKCSIVGIPKILFIYLSVDGYLTASTFGLFWIMLLWICIYTYCFESSFSIFLCVYIPRSRYSGTFDNFMFNFLRNCHTIVAYFYPKESSLVFCVSVSSHSLHTISTTHTHTQSSFPLYSD